MAQQERSRFDGPHIRAVAFQEIRLAYVRTILRAKSDKIDDDELARLPE